MFIANVRSTLLVACLCLLAAAAAHAQGRGELWVGNKRADTAWRIDLDTGRKLGQVDTAAAPHEIAVSPDERWIVVTTYGHDSPGNALTVIDATNQATRAIGLGSHTRPHGARFLPDGQLLVTAEGDGSLLRVDVETGTVAQAIPVGMGTGHMVAVAADGRTAYVSKIAAGTVSRIDLASGRKTAEVSAGKGAEGIGVARDGSVWVTNRADDTVTVHDPDTLSIRATLASAGFPIRLAFSADGQHALVTNATAATLSVFDVATRERVATVPLAPPDVVAGETMLGKGALPIGIAVHPDGERVYVAISGMNRIAVIRTGAWRVTGYWATGAEPDALGIVGARHAAAPAMPSAERAADTPR